MKLFPQAVFTCLILVHSIVATAQTLGNYPDANMVAGENKLVAPNAAPASTSFITVFAGANFTGVLSVNPATGVVSITNAKLAGIYTITVKAFNGVASVSKTFTLTVTNPLCSQGLFYGTSNTVGSQPFAVIIGDFNNDNNQDFVSANTGANNLSVRLGDGAGGFTSGANVAVGASPKALAVADFNADGKQDVAVANMGAAIVSIRLGNGTGGFTNAADVTVGSSPGGIAVGDFNGDGRTDFVTTNEGALTASVRLGNGTGGFTNAADLTFAFQAFPKSVAVGDFNLDGKQDLAITTDNVNEVTLNLGDGTGGFTRVTDINQRVFVGAGPMAIAMGDFNNNGAIDFVTANFFAGSISLRFGTNTGGFVGNSIYDFPVGQSPEHVAVADVNGDGNQDILVTLGGSGSGSVMVLRGNGTGTFSAANSTTISPLTTPAWIAPGDFNQDRRIDLLIANKSSLSPAVAIQLGGVNEINISGNGVTIPDGDKTPSPGDHTDFGTVGGSFARTFTIQNTGTTVLGITSITSSNPQFSISGAPSTVVAGGSANFQVTFTGTAGAVQNATITIQNNDCDEAVYDFVVTATTQPTLGNYPNITVRAADDTTLIPLSAPQAGRIFAYTDARFTGQFAVNPISGVIRILNPQPAGTYPVTVKAFNGTDSVTKTFTLTVGAPLCSTPDFTSTSAQNLTVTVSPNAVRFGDFNNDGFQDIITANNSSTATLRLGAGNGTFGAAISISIGSAPRGVCLGDFNGDGNLDFACADRNGGNVYVRLGNGAGGFSNAPEFNAGSLPENITAADFNNDGKLDLAIANAGGGTVSVGIGNGLGGFTAAAAIPVGTTPFFIATADFNNDGKTDLAVANNTAASVSIRLGNGLGGFSGTTNITVGTNPYHLAVGDFNNDGKYDFASTSFAYPGPVSVRLGDGAGGFSNMPDLPVGNRSTSIAAADFNADGRLDLAIGESITNSIYIRTGDGAGNFAANASSLVNSSPASLAVGDVNNDGILDFVSAASNAASAINVRFGISTDIKVFGNAVPITPGDITPSQADHADLGGLSGSLVRTFTIQNNSQQPLLISSVTSGNPQLVVSNAPATVAAGGSATFQVTATPVGSGIQSSTITISSNACASRTFTFLVQATALPVMPDYPDKTITWGANQVLPPNSAPKNTGLIYAYSTPKFGGVFSVNSLTGEVQVSAAQQTGVFPVTVVTYNGIYPDSSTFNLTVTKPACGSGNFTGTTEVAAGNLPFALAMGDFNRDGKQDLVTADYQGGTVSIRIGDGLGGFSGSGSLTGFGQATAVAVADFNRDGAEDLAISSQSASSIYIRMGNPTGTFTGTTSFAVGAGPRDVAIGDFNRDGFMDIASANNASNTVSILSGDGNGSFSAPANFPAGAAPTALVVGDFNNDNRADLAVTNGTAGTVSILLGIGTGGFAAPASFNVGNTPRDITPGDFNADGFTDLAVVNNGSNSISIRLGTGTGSFTGSTDLALAVKPYGIVAGDFNSDGKTDFATANYDAGSLAVRFGDGTGLFTGTNSVAVNLPYQVIAGDFNRDGIQDLATANFGSNSVSVRLGAGNAIQLSGNNENIFDGAQTPSLSNHTDFGLLGDTLLRTFSIRNAGTGTLAIDSIRSTNAFFVVRNAPASVPAGGTATFTLTYNFGGSGVQNSTITVYNKNCDLAVYDFAVRAEKSAPPFLGNYPATSITAGNTTFITPDAPPLRTAQTIAYTTNGFPGVLSVDPVTGILQVVTANQPGIFVITVQATLGLLTTTKTCTLTVTKTLCGNGSFTGTSNPAAGAGLKFVAAGDFNGDGNPDLAVTNATDGTVSVRLGDGSGGFSGTTTVSVGTNPRGIAIGDFNGDGRQDMAVAKPTGPNHRVAIRLGDGLGGFTGNTEIGMGINSLPNSVVVADFNGDGKLDFATSNIGTGSLSVCLGDGSGGFAAPVSVSTGTGSEPNSLAVGDFNNDGKPDLATALYQSNTAVIALGNGAGGFTLGTPVAVGSRPISLVVGDFNGDGNPDVATANAVGSSLSVRLGNGLGGLTGTYNVSNIDVGPAIIAAGDFNGDGITDLAVTHNNNFNKVTIRFGDGTGQFNGLLSVPVGSQPLGLAIGDWNKDGRQDLVTGNGGTTTFSVRMGVAGGDNVWLGITTDWNDPANWSAGSGPGICTRAVVNAGVPNMPTISGTQNSCATLKLGNGATINMAKDAKLNITGQ